MQFATGSSNPEFIINKWKLHDAIPCSDFIYREPILAQRITIFNLAGVRAKRKIEAVVKMSEGIQSMLLNLVSEARKEESFNLATRYLATLNSMQLSSEIKVFILSQAGEYLLDCGAYFE